MLGAQMVPAEAEESERAQNSHYLFETIWALSGQLEPEKQARLVPIFLEAAALSEDPAFLETWEAQTGQTYEPGAPYTDYALEKVSRFIAAEGWDAFFTRAETRAYPLNSGRPEMMAAAAQHLADDETAARIYALMERLGNQDQSQAGFERASFGHALVEAAMHACDLERFDRALEMTDAPDSIRYALWRTRMEGRPEELAERITEDFDAENSLVLRQALDGYGDVLRLGMCARPSPETPVSSENG